MTLQWVEAKRKTTGEIVKLPVFVVNEDECQNMILDHCGLCLSCGADCEGVEPDAVGYRCEDCGMNKVYGVENALLMGRVKFKIEEEYE